MSVGSVARGVSWVGAGHVVSQLAWFGSLIYVAARLSPAAFGSVTIAMVMVQVAWLVVGSGTRGSFVVAKDVSRAQVQWAVAVNVASGLRGRARASSSSEAGSSRRSRREPTSTSCGCSR